MLIINVPGTELFNEVTREFIEAAPTVLILEHSLISLSKWESVWNKPFLGRVEKTNEEILDYIKHMTVTRNVNANVYLALTNENYKAINDYIQSSMTATTFSDTSAGRSAEVITSELIYYWMIALNIPFECQKWHLNRLLTLIRVCNVKNSPAKKMSRRELITRNRALNESRRNRLNTSG